MPSPISALFEKAIFSDARKADYRFRWLLFILVLMLLASVYSVARDIVYTRLVYRFAQEAFNGLASASVEKIGHVEIDRQGDITLRHAEAWTHRRGERRLFFRAEELRLTLDGMPLRDNPLRVMRVDLFRPEIFVRREPHGEWNLSWALVRSTPAAPAAPEPEDDPWKHYRRPDEGFPHNGVHIHDGTLHVTFVSKSGKEVTWRITGVRAVLTRRDGTLTLRPFAGGFYGGRITADAELPQTRPLTIHQLMVDVRDADVARMAEGAPFIKHAVRGKFNMVLSLALDKERTRQRPIASGRAEITEGNLWELPALSGVLSLLTLTSVSDRRIDSAILEFTVEEDQIRVEKMHFLGYPVSLFGDGACSLTGDWIDVAFIPRLGKSDWNSILPVIGTPIQWLSDIVKGALVPVVLSGSFDDPKLEVDTGYFLQPSVRQLIEEKSPR
jgi:hypothetical protein